MTILEDSSTITLKVIPRDFDSTTTYPTVTLEVNEEGTDKPISTFSEDTQVKNSDHFVFTFLDPTDLIVENRIYSYELKSNGNLIHRGKFYVGYASGGSFDPATKQSVHEDISGNNDYKSTADSDTEYVIIDN